MKKIIIICLLLLCGCSNIDIVNAKHKTDFDQIKITDYQNIMIVAHPDDETIWGGAHLLQDKYLVVCLTNGNNHPRAQEFHSILKATNDTGIILDYPDKIDGKRDNWQTHRQDIENDLRYLLTKHRFKTIITHNPKGEYGHHHHKVTSNLTTKLVKSLSQTKQLNYFGRYYKKSNPILPMDPTYNSEILNQKMQLIAKYTSQAKVCQHLAHMLPYENWISYASW